MHMEWSEEKFLKGIVGDKRGLRAEFQQCVRRAACRVSTMCQARVMRFRSALGSPR